MPRSRASLASNVRSSTTIPRIVVVGLTALGLACWSGCGSDGGSSIGDGHKVQQPDDDGGTVQCEVGATKACFVYVGENSGILSCYEGVQTCGEDGRYGPCQDGTVVKRLRAGTAPAGGMRVLSLSDAGSCQDNPCDPSCQVFDEEPDGGLSLGVEGDGPQWQTADIKSLEDANWPAGLYKKGISEPCFSNMDCQYDQYCFEPHTAAACSHSKCSTGAGLVSTCDQCVTAVCAKMPSCCTSAQAQCLAAGTACPGATACCHGLACTGGTCQPPALFEKTFSDLHANGWTQTSGGSWQVGPAASGSNDPATDTTPTADNWLVGTVIGGAYANNSNYTLFSPIINTTGTGSLTLTLRSWEQFEANWDYGRIWVSTDGTNFSQTIYSTSATQSLWKSLSFDIGAYRSSQFRLAFQLTSDGSVVNGGWSLDDIVIRNACQPTGASCAQGQACCSDSSCVNGVCATASGGWNEACIDKVGEVCGSYCPTTGTCDHAVCLAGGPLNATCDSCVQAICALDPTCCSTAWGNHCVAKVGPVCNQNCVPPVGDCRQYNPGESNPYCVGSPDFTAGVPCGNTVPICNRGDVAVAANSASFFYFPGMSQNNDFTSCNVGGNFPNNAERCPIAVEIPPGECRSITCAGLGNNGGIVVNPPAQASIVAKFPGYAAVPECNCQNNWSLFKQPKAGDPPCGAPACLSTSVEAKIPTVNMYIMFDKSGSMSGNRWTLTTQALRGFIRDPASAGLRVALRFFPSTVGGIECGGTTCTDVGCKVPEVPLGTLLAAQGTDTTCGSMPNNCSNAADPQECALVKAIRCASPNGWTPLLTALGGATSYMGDHAGTYPMERSVVVLVTDGYPEGATNYPADCRSPANTNFVTKAANAYASYGVVTYTVNVVGGSATLMQNIATAGHGQYFYVSDANASTELVNALNQIRANSVSCDLLLNSSMGINPYDVTVSFTPTGGTLSNFTQVVTAADCGTNNDRYYYDDNTNPTKITLCPATCARVRADVGAKIGLEIGCPNNLEAETYPFTYSASCPPGTRAQWGQLTWAATTPGNSNVKFEGRTSENITTFDTPPVAGELKNLGTAHANVAPFTGDTQSCTMFGPAPTCPVDLYARLGLPAANYSHLELHVTLNPSTTGASQSPTLDDWDVTYSCAQTE